MTYHGDENPGALIKAARLARRWTQDMLAAESGVSARTIGRIENNQVSEPTSYDRLQQALEIGPYELTPVERRLRNVSAAVDGPPLRKATHDELAQEFVRRLNESAQGGGPRIRPGQMPEGFLDQPGVISDRPQSDETGADGGA